MIGIVRIALQRPYTFIVLALLILIMGTLALLRTPTDIFPNINIPIVALAWQYAGLPPDQMSGRITTPSQRALTTTVNDIEHIEATSYTGFGIVKIFFHPTVDINMANAQVTAISQTMTKQMPPGTTPPLILNYSASTVPILQLALSGKGLSEQALADLGMNQLRSRLITVQGAAIPWPFGGKSRQVQIDLDSAALQARGLTAQDVSNALAAQNLVVPAGTQKIGTFEYSVNLNNAPSDINALGDLPIKTVNGAMVYVRDVAHVRDGAAVQGNIVHVDGGRSVLMSVFKNGTTSTLDIIDGVKKLLEELKPSLPDNLEVKAIGDQSMFVRNAISGVVKEGVIAAALTSLMILLFLGSWRSTLIVTVSIPLSILGAVVTLSAFGETLEHHDARRPGARGRHPRRRGDRDDREHQLPPRARQAGRDSNHGRRLADRRAGVRFAAVHLHRLHPDVLPRRGRALPVRADGRGRDVRDGVLVHPVAHARADDGEVPAQAARRACR